MQKRVNLVPQKPFADKIKGIIPVILLFLGLFITFFVGYRVQSLKADLIQVTEEITKAEHLTEDLRTLKETINRNETVLGKLKKEKKQRWTLVSTLSKLKGSKHHFSQPLAIIADSLPATIRCQSLTFNGKSGVMTGTALDYDDLIHVVYHLQNQSLFRQVALTVTDRNNNQELERITFTITMLLT